MTARTVPVCAAALTALLGLAPAPAFGLDSIGEEFGNAPIRARPGLSPGVLSILNDTHRVYLYFVESDGYKSYSTAYFQGDTSAAHEALRRFAALGKGLDVVLLPGPREVATLRTAKVRADWELYVPTPGRGLGRGRRDFDMRPTLYLYVRGRVPTPSAVPATVEQVERWLKELNAGAFQDRERAFAELEKQGLGVRDALHKALEGNPPAETRRRVGLLLAKLERLPGVNLGELAVPEGVRILGPDELLARYREALKSENVRVRGEVAQLLSRFGPDPAALKTLVEMLSDKGTYPRQLAIRALARMGKTAAPALPALRKGLDDPTPYVRADCRAAIAAIEAAKDEPDAAERADEAKVVRQEIGRFLKGQPGAAKN